MMVGMPSTVVLLHGFTNTGASWAGVIEALPETYRALAPDIRGHGDASGARPVTLDAVVGDVADLSAGPFTLVGYSMGGRIALHVALAIADRVQRLVLIGASPGLRDASARAERRTADERLARTLEHSTIEEFAERWAQTPVLADQAPDVRARVDVDRRRNTPEALAAALRGLGTGALPSLWPRLGEVRVPVQLVVGQRDHKFRETAEQMTRMLPSSELTLVTDAGHAVHWEAPGAVAEVIGQR
jgi:2-succinyl-6-hydroxy-2,4-cyclohexadiene-1-carboxylate synthase